MLQLKYNIEDKLIKIDKATFQIGRADDNDFIINETHISKHHARIEIDQDNQPWIIDLKSKNGVYLNNNKIETKTELTGGDIISIGKKNTFTVILKEYKSLTSIINKSGDDSWLNLIEEADDAGIDLDTHKETIISDKKDMKWPDVVRLKYELDIYKKLYDFSKYLLQIKNKPVDPGTISDYLELIIPFQNGIITTDNIKHVYLKNSDENLLETLTNYHKSNYLTISVQSFDYLGIKKTIIYKSFQQKESTAFGFCALMRESSFTDREMFALDLITDLLEFF
jgi:pSer/pThr/pTyr-binding forkhead associated (FHA) protein